MKTALISGFLLLILAAYLVIPVMPVIHYLINKDYIAQNLCINKDKPKSCCKGKCHMVKQLQKANQNSEKDPKNTGNKIQIKELNEFIIGKANSFIAVFSNFFYSIHNQSNVDQLACTAIFVPPKHS